MLKWWIIGGVVLFAALLFVFLFIRSRRPTPGKIIEDAFILKTDVLPGVSPELAFCLQTIDQDTLRRRQEEYMQTRNKKDFVDGIAFDCSRSQVDKATAKEYLNIGEELWRRLDTRIQYSERAENFLLL